jgi:hypothetical protein
MRIKRLRIENFRSIRDLTLTFGKLNAICGPNSCGKSNVLRAIQFAFREDLTRDDVQANLIASRRDNGGARLAIHIEIEFEDCPRALTNKVGAQPGRAVLYRFTATRTAKVTRELHGKPITPGDIRAYLDLVYVPAIRDLAAGGMEPFRRLLSQALRKARGNASLATVTDRARAVLVQKANALLANHASFVRQTLGAESIHPDTSEVTLENLYDLVTLKVLSNGATVSLGDLGTGHQSALIIHLYRQLGEVTSGDTLFLFEEPDNHLHPSTIRAIGDDLRTISERAQVIATTHSPILLSHVGFSTVRSLHPNQSGETTLRTFDLTGVSDKFIRATLQKFGLRVTEPLLTRRIIVTEGAADANVLAHFASRRLGRSPDQMDVVIAVAGSKSNVVELCGFLRRLDVDWRAVLDFDAAVSDVPYTRDRLSPEQIADAKAALERVSEILDGTRSRGQGCERMLTAISGELANGRRPEQIYDGSVLMKLLNGYISAQATAALVAALGRRARTQFQPVLARERVWMWSNSLEDAIIPSDPAADIVEAALIRAGQNGAPANQNKREHLKKRLHNSAHDVELLQSVIDSLDDGGHFRRMEMVNAVDFLFAGL